MKKLSTLVILIAAFAINTFSNPTEQDNVKALINKAYVEGIHNRGSLEDVANGFHPDFEMIINRDGVLSKYPISTWIESMKASRERNPDQVVERTDINYLFVDVTGNAASVKFELIKGGKVIFTDYMFLYKFGEDWKIVSKIFYRH